MAIADVNTWLAGQRNFAAGIELLKEHGKPSSMLLALFDRGETGYARERLAEALQALANKAIEHQQGQKVRSRTHPAMQAAALVTAMSPELDDWPMSRYPVELQDVKRELVSWMREYDSLHGELPRIPTKEERYRTALRMKELDDMIHGAFYRLDTFRSTGTDIGAIEERPKTRAELLVERNNLRSYICKIQKGTRKASTEQLYNFKSRLSLIQTSLDAGE